MLSQERLTRNRSCFRIPEPVSLATGASTSETDTRIEHSVQNVGDDVAQDDQHGDQIQDRSREHVVLLEDRLKQVPTHPVVGEDLLQNNRPADHEAEADRQRRHYRQIGVPGDVAVANLSRRQALRARGQDEVFAEDLEHRGLHEEDRTRRADQDEGEHRQRAVHDDVRRLEQEASPGQGREVLRRPRRIAVSVEREDRDREPEGPQQDEADPEGRHVVEEQARDDRHAFRLAAMPRDEPPNRDADQILRDQRAAEQEQRPRQRDGENLGDGPSLRERATEIEREHVPEENPELNVPGLVEAELDPKLGPTGRLARRVLRVGRERAARQRLEQQEDNDGHNENRDDTLNAATDQIPPQRGQPDSPPTPVLLTVASIFVRSPDRTEGSQKWKRKGTGAFAPVVRA